MTNKNEKTKENMTKEFTPEEKAKLIEAEKRAAEKYGSEFEK